MQRYLALATFAALTFSLSACDGKKGAESKKATATADKIWTERCVTCHGNTGNGDGPGAAALDPKPRSFSDPAWQASVDNDRIKKVIVEGGASVGLSALMAPNPDLASQPAVQDALVKKIRKFVQ